MKKFFNPNTVYDPDYRNVQSELWTLLSDEQRAVVGGVFKHLKNHAQIEIAEALIDYVEEDIRPDIRDWSDILNAILFNYILFRAFGINITAGTWLVASVAREYNGTYFAENRLNRYCKL